MQHKLIFLLKYQYIQQKLNFSNNSSANILKLKILVLKLI